MSSSSNEVMKANSAPAMIPGRTIGIVTDRRVRVRLAPRLIAAHSRRSSKFFNVAATMIVTYGMASTEWPNTIPIGEPSRRSGTYIRNRPTASTITGSTSGSSSSVWTRFLPRN